MKLRTPLAAAVLVSALTLASCGAADSPSPAANGNQTQGTGEHGDGNGESTNGHTVIKHAFGETVIEGKPERVATVAWGNHEVPLALGVVPVGMSKATWGDDNGDGVLPWVDARLKELDAPTPTLFDETDGLPLEQIADTQPDVILATYSGITREDYEQLSKIAPTIAYPDTAWATTYEQMVDISSQALGMPEEGAEYLKKLQADSKKEFANYPALKGKKILFTSFGQDDTSTVGFYTTHDTRVSFPLAHGMEAPEVVKKESAKTQEFWTKVSAEKPELFDDVDLFVSYGSNDPAENKKLLEKLQKDPLVGKIRAVKEGHVAFLGEDPLAAAANPSPLSIPATLHDYLSILDAAVHGKAQS